MGREPVKVETWWLGESGDVGVQGKVKTLKYKKIDAFTSNGSAGNPAACIYLDESQSLTDSEMLSIAKRHKGFVSEVVFCKNAGGPAYELAYFSSECEVPFCGHGTIACMYEALKGQPDLKEATVRTRTKGDLIVYNRIAEQNAVYISAPEPEYLDSRVSTYELLGANPDGFIDAGNRTLIVPVESLGDAVGMSPDEYALKEFTLANGIDIILIYCMDTKSSARFAHTRVFAAKYGYLEDPATGSASAAFGYYLLKRGLWDGGEITLEQGCGEIALEQSGGEIALEQGCGEIALEQSGGGIVYNAVSIYYADGRVRFGGGATLKIDGLYYL